MMIKRHWPKLLMLVGVVIILAAVLLKLDAGRQQDDLVKQYDRYIAQLKQEQPSGEGDKNKTPTPTPRPIPADEEGEPETAELPEVLDNPDEPHDEQAEKPAPVQPDVIGILSIPKIDLTVAVGEGVDRNTLKYTVGHFTQTAHPGANGNFSVIGHRNYTFGEFFNRLDEVEVGDAVVVKSGVHTYTYKVTESYVVNPEDTWVLNPTEDAQITLITCTPVRVATHRLVVKGVLDTVE